MVAPNDEQVQRLRSSLRGVAVERSGAAASAPVSINDSEIEELSEADIEVGNKSPTRRAAQVAPPGRAAHAAVLGARGRGRSEATANPSDYGDYAESRSRAAPAANPRPTPSRSTSWASTPKAIDAAQEGIEVHPQSVPIRRKLRDILYEAGEYPRTADEMVTIASILLDNGDAEGSAEELAAVLSFCPTTGPLANAARHGLRAAQLAVRPIQRSRARPTGSRNPPPKLSYAGLGTRVELDSAPLPSYDLEEVGAAEAMSSPGYDVTAEAYEKRLAAARSKGGSPASPWTIRTRPRSPLPKRPPR